MLSNIDSASVLEKFLGNPGISVSVEFLGNPGVSVSVNKPDRIEEISIIIFGTFYELLAHENLHHAQTHHMQKHTVFFSGQKL